MRGSFRFTETHASTTSRARCGLVRTPHGSFTTPAFMPVGTQATVKGLMPEDVRATGAEIILANTYHLSLRPGEDFVAGMGGLHSFMNWDAPILTDSGGYQVFSLSNLRTITDEGVQFRSHIDGSPRFLGPREAMDIQTKLGADILMSFDECLPYPSTIEYAAQSIERTRRWEEESLKRHPGSGRAVFGIVQGGVYAELRERSARDILALPFDGYAMGGLFIGEERAAAVAMLDLVAPMIPASHARYVMGVGTPLEIIDCVILGWDMFDCVLPTRNGRHGQAMTFDGPLRLRNAAMKRDERPIEPDCPCPACGRFSRAYLHHLIHAGEILGMTLVSRHNLSFMQRLMARIRGAITDGTLEALRDDVARHWSKHSPAA